MNQSAKSPRQTLRQIFGSGKIMFVCIIFSIAALSLLIHKINNSPDFTTFTIFGFEIDLLSLLGEELGNILKIANKVILIFGIISIAPQILTAVAFWLIKLGAGNDSASTKKALIGLNLFKIPMLFHGLSYVLALMGAILLGMFAMMLCFDQISTQAGLIALVVVVIIASVISMFYKYYLDFYAMIVGVSLTLKTGKNMLSKSSFVITMNWIIAIYGILSCFGDGFWGIVAGICESLCLIFITNCFTGYTNVHGSLTKEEFTQSIKEYVVNPELAQSASILGINQAPELADDKNFLQKSNGTFGLLKLYFSLAVIPEDGEMPAYSPKPAPAAAANTAASYHSPVQARPASYNNSETSASKPKTNYQATRTTIPQTIPENFKIIASHVLKLFSDDIEQIDSRYSVLGKKAFRKEISCPVTPVSAQVLLDSISEKKILRISLQNRSASTVKAIKLELIPKSNSASVLGIIKDTSLVLENALAPQSCAFAEYGIVLPDETTNGTFKITYVEFEDGLFWDKTSEELVFSTNEKTEFDMNLYLSLMNK